jgi:hypothetical protein
MATEKKTLTLNGNPVIWKEIDPESLAAQQSKLYSAYTTVRKAAAEAREAFEEAMQDGRAVPAGKRLVFTYNFGRLSVALADGKVKKASAKAVDWSKMFAGASAGASVGKAA